MSPRWRATGANRSRKIDSTVPQGNHAVAHHEVVFVQHQFCKQRHVFGRDALTAGEPMFGALLRYPVRQHQARTVKRYYQALVRGVLEAGGTVDEPIGRHPTQRTKMAVVQSGKPARTHFRVVERFIDCTLVECALETGRTHQIRVHMTALGHPLVGDQVYGSGASRVPIGPEFPRQALHARRLGLVHPATGKPMLWKSNMPEDMAELIETARLLAFEARALAEEESDDWDDDFDDGPEIIYAYGDSTEDDDDID